MKFKLVFEYDINSDQSDKQVVEDLMLCVRDDVLGYLDGKRLFPCEVEKQ